MKNVFVETNWIVAVAAPAHLRSPAAVDLKDRASRGEIQIYVPAICLTEAQHPIRSKYQPRGAADAIRKYLAGTAVTLDLNDKDIQTVRRVLDVYESRVLGELDRLPQTLEDFHRSLGVEVFALDEEMLRRSVEFSTKQLDLKPFDQAILSAILVRAEQLQANGEVDFCFCELDGDL